MNFIKNLFASGRKQALMAGIAVLFAGLMLAGCSNTPGETYMGQPPLEGEILILQAYGAGVTNDGAVSHTFVELYNTTDKDINLSTSSIQYATGIERGVDPADLEDYPYSTDWKVINLTGTIPAYSSYLIRGVKMNEDSGGQVGRLQIESADKDVTDFRMSNRAFVVALMSNQTKLNVANPFDTDGNGTKAAGYLDLLGAINDAGAGDSIEACETGPARNSKQQAPRRNSLTDTDNNASDFSSVDYRSVDMTIPQPRTSSEGPWNPITGESGESGESGETPDTDNTLLIFQIGAATDGNISHSFVELYNNGATAVNLSGYSLQYAEGTRNDTSATEDGAWNKIDLTGTILPKHSFLVLGDEGTSTNPALSLTEGSGDMNPAGFVISNRSFKVVLLKNTTLLTAAVQNPFDTDGEGAKVSGYVDMVGAMNTVGEDKIFGYETAAITNLNKQTGQRRTSLSDTDNNAADFARATYSGATAANLEMWRPKNLAYGEWDPFEVPIITPPGPTDNTLLIFQIGAATDGNISHSFVELYNNGATAVNLSGYSLQYAEGTRNDTSATEDGAWNKIDLTGTILPKHSFLVLGDEGIGQTGTPALSLEGVTGDMNPAGFVISNRSFKVVLLKNTTLLTAAVQNPFDTDGEGAKVSGYVDMVGAMNTVGEDKIFGYETAAITNLNKQTGQRRTSLSDTDNNAADFTRATYSGATAANLEMWRPKNLAYGEWDPFAEPVITPDPGVNTLLIYQIGAATDGNISHSFVELYNNGATAVNLSGYSLQYAEGTRNTPSATTDGAWTKINLSGTIPPQHSFLILGDKGIGQTGTPALSLTEGSGDMNPAGFVISNRSFKVVLLKNTTLLTAAVQNPFDTDGEGAKVSDYVDMVGAMNTVGEDKINGFEKNAITNLNKQTGQRRTSRNDTDNNAADFDRATYLGATAANLEIWRPKNLAYGAWNPVTGVKDQ